MRNRIGLLLAVAVTALLAAPSASAKEYYRGCLVGTHDNYMLRTDDGQLYRLHSHSEDDFKAHLGPVVPLKKAVLRGLLAVSSISHPPAGHVPSRRFQSAFSRDRDRGYSLLERTADL